MATSGQVKTNEIDGEYYYVNWQQASQSISGNYTDINWQHGVHLIYNYYSNGVQSYGVGINGGSVYGGGTFSYLNAGDHQLASGTLRIYHGNDGKKTFNINTSGWLYGSGTMSGSQNFTLNDIPRKATVSSSTANFTDEDNPVLKYSNPAGNSVNTLQACIADTTGNTIYASYRNISKTGSSYTFELTQAEREALRNATPNSNSLTIRFYIKTILGSSTYYDYLAKTMTIVNGNPTFSDYTYQDTNTTVSTLLGTNQILVKGLSNLKVTIPVANKMTAIKGASPSKYIASIDTLNASGNYSSSAGVDITVGSVENAGTFELIVGAYDTRNNHTDITKEVEVLDYSLPVLYATATRTNNFENETTLTLNGTFSDLIVNNVNKNAVTSCQYRYREVDGTWGSYSNFTFTTSGNNYTCTNKIENLDNTKAYEIEFKVSDRVSSKTLNLIVAVGKSIFFIDKKNRLLYYNDVEMLQYDVVEVWSD